MIYFDNAATTALHPEVLDKMRPFLDVHLGNPSSIHKEGRVAKQAIDEARRDISSFLGCSVGELVFTSGGTEANHSALFGGMLASERRHFVSTAVEHHAVLHTLEFLESLGAEVTLIQPDDRGRIRVQDVISSVRPDTVCVSVMAVNNELGTIEPIREIVKAVKELDDRILVHSDMIQALGTIRCDLRTIPVDFATFSAHKIHGPKGIGALFIRGGANWKPVLYGGSQEKKRRAGTENVSGIVGFGAAVNRLERTWQARMEQLKEVNHMFWEGIAQIPGVKRYSPDDAVPTILNVGFAGVRNDTLLMRLDLEGVAASAGSACTAGSLEPSHVLSACGVPEDEIRQAIRFSFSEDNTVEQVHEVTRLLQRIVPILRK